MTWFRVDDGFYDHPKTAGLSDAAVAMWTRAGSWCARYLTDGKMPLSVALRFGPQNVIDELVQGGLWERLPDGIQFHDWFLYQDTKEEVEADRRKWRETKRKVRSAKSKGKSKMSTVDTQADSTGESPMVSQVLSSPSSPSSSYEEDPPLPPKGASAALSPASGGHNQEVQGGWADAYFAAGAGTPPVIAGQNFAAAVEFARRVAMAHGKPLRETAKAICGAVLAARTPAKELPFALARLDPYAPSTGAQAPSGMVKTSAHMGGLP